MSNYFCVAALNLVPYQCSAKDLFFLTLLPKLKYYLVLPNVLLEYVAEFDHHL
jgi:hypothetical protein